uniref:Galactose mutarotase n=1 Tax=Meloidogyne javanica TaxID=6303 RepID=A0A915LXM6_MELJA
MSTIPKYFGKFKGEDVLECQLISKTGVCIKILNYGAIIRDWQIPLLNGNKRCVVLGFDNIEDYIEYSPFFGAIVGRVANRIGGAKFVLEGKEYLLDKNEGLNHLHGGKTTFGKRMTQISENSVQLTIFSSEEESGYPGNLNVKVIYKLVDNLLEIYTPTNKEMIPTGEIINVDNTLFDFRNGKLLNKNTSQPLELDNNFILNNRNSLEEPVAILKSPDNLLILKLWTDQPALQIKGINNQLYPPFGGICLEDQQFPDAVNHPKVFPSIIISPTNPYKHLCKIEIA